MDIYLNDTLTKEKRKFEPLKQGEVSMYNCGPTVYNYAHIGNLRSYVFADILRRTFEYNGYKVNQVINITDIGHLSSDNDDGEDKMTKALKREGKPLTLEAMREVANFYFEEFKKDLASLNIELPEHFPFASDHIQEDINLVQTLTDKGFTYSTSDGVYFETSKYKDYNNIFGIDRKKLIEEFARVIPVKEKKNHLDFALWKFDNKIGYDSQFGKGFPGWHIECSAMSVKYLGPEFDIHTGGIDHIPVHHSNEIAQAVCAGNPYAKYWLHNAHLNMATENGSEKMAKSGDNFIKLQSLKDKGIDPLALRYVFLGARYSSPLQFSWEALEGADTSIKTLRLKIYSYPDNGKIIVNKFNELVNDDLDTPKALALVWEIIKDREISDADKKATILDFDRVLGLELAGYKLTESIKIPEEVQNLIKERDLARNTKDFTKSDELRAKIEEFGFEVKDTPDGTVVTPR